MKYSLKIILSILIFFSLFGCKKNVDLIVYNANVYTVDNDFTIVNAIAIKDGLFFDVGGNDILKNTMPKKLMISTVLLFYQD